MASSFTHKWIPRVDQQEKNLFIEEYYSSTDTQIVMDDEEQTEIGYINYSVQEQLKPLYGYASRTFDDVAIGNRIVTGSFKVPIKNPEVQTPLNDIISSQDSSNGDYSTYNTNQEELQTAVDWIKNNSNTSKSNISTSYYEDDEVFAYSEKLSALGYAYENASMPTTSITNQIKAFQSANNINGSSGILTDETKQAIDDAISKSNLDTIKLPAGTVIYSGPAATKSIVTTLKTAQSAYMIDDIYDDGWAHIMLADGTEGYVDTSKL